MTRVRLKQTYSSDTPHYYYIACCAHRAFLCGKYQLSGQHFEHRRQWILDRLAQFYQIPTASLGCLNINQHVHTM